MTCRGQSRCIYQRRRLYAANMTCLARWGKEGCAEKKSAADEEAKRSKPTRGRNPLGPMLGDIFGGLVAEHVESRSVRDTAATLDATAGPEIGDPYAAPPRPDSYLAAIKRKPKKLSTAFTTRRLNGETCDPECKTATETAARLCDKLGHHVEENMPQVSVDIRANFAPIWASGLTMVVDSIAKAASKPPARDDFEGFTWSLYQFGKTITAAPALLGELAGLLTQALRIPRHQQTKSWELRAATTMARLWPDLGKQE